MALPVTDLTGDEKMVVAEFARSPAFAAMLKVMQVKTCNDWMAGFSPALREAAWQKLEALASVEIAIKSISKEMKAV